jgi:hypothetical protein
MQAAGCRSPADGLRLDDFMDEILKLPDAIKLRALAAVSLAMVISLLLSLRNDQGSEV